MNFHTFQALDIAQIDSRKNVWKGSKYWACRSRGKRFGKLAGLIFPARSELEVWNIFKKLHAIELAAYEAKAA